MSSTGKAALNIGGRTIHSVCPTSLLSSQKSYNKCDVNKCQQALWEVKLVIIDECSMSGLKMLGQVSETFQAVNCNYEDPMGGVHYILLGDLFQLDPVQDTQMFKESAKGVKQYWNF